MSLRILNDIHAGVIRSGGTTPSSALALRQHVIDELEKLLPDSDLMILGDLFDKENVPIVDLLKVYDLFMDWLLKGYKLYLVAGNHDLSKTSSVISSFDMLGGLLYKLYPSQVRVIKEAQMTEYGYVIPHVANQDLFNLELEKVPACDYLFLHVNYDNKFAAQLDQSLNLSKQQASALPVQRIISGHEHHQRILGKLIYPGNQICTSISDWGVGDDRAFIELRDKPELISYKCKELLFDAIQYTELSKYSGSAKFIKVLGRVKPEESASVVTAISKFRQRSEAFIVSNAVEIESEDETESFKEALTEIKSFNVWGSLQKFLTEEEFKILESLKDAN